MTQSCEAFYSKAGTAGRYRVHVSIGLGAIAIVRSDGAAFDDGRQVISWLFETISDDRSASSGTGAVLRSDTDHGSLLYVEDAAFLKALGKATPSLAYLAGAGRLIKLGLVVAVLIGLLYGAVQFYRSGPSQKIAEAIPAKWRAAVGQQLHNAFVVQHGRCTNSDGNAALQRLFGRLVARAGGETGKATVTVLDWKLVNGFAGPGGRIFLTRGLIEAARSPDEVAGVLAHELGHARLLHPEAGVVRGMGISAILAFLTGGSGGTLTNAANFLLRQSYSREAEREADELGIAYLRDNGIAVDGMIAFFERLAKKEGRGLGASNALNDLMSTHPATEDRVARLKAVAPYASRPAMTNEEWASLRAICKGVSRKPEEAS